jgi:hypothetical protein
MQQHLDRGRQNPLSVNILLKLKILARIINLKHSLTQKITDT